MALWVRSFTPHELMFLFFTSLKEVSVQWSNYRCCVRILLVSAAHVSSGRKDVKWWVSKMESVTVTHPLLCVLPLCLQHILLPTLTFSISALVFPPLLFLPHLLSLHLLLPILPPTSPSTPSTLTPLTPSSASHLSRCPRLAGGLLTERYLGKAEPSTRAELYTASLSKYKNTIDTWGGWSLFQDLLVALETVAKRHDCSVASVATRYVLDRPAVGGVIVGCRLGIAGAGQHISESLRSCSPDLKLTEEDLASIRAVTRRSRDLLALIGDCGDEYRS